MLVDDLVTQGAREPYRMFTSRAEHRLLLREDNADLRLTPTGRALGLVDDERWALFEHKRAAAEAEVARLERSWIKAASVEAWATRVTGAPLPRDASALDLLRRPDVGYADLLALGDETLPDFAAGNPLPALAALDDRLPEAVQLQVEVRAKYSGYIERQQQDIERARRNESLRLPEDLDYARLGGLSNEVKQKLTEARPATLGQASRVPGITPAAVSILLVHLKKRAG